MSTAREIQAAVELLREHGLYALDQHEVFEICLFLRHVGGDIKAIRHLMEQCSDRAMYRVTAERAS